MSILDAVIEQTQRNEETKPPKPELFKLKPNASGMIPPRVSNDDVIRKSSVRNPTGQGD